MQFRDQPSAARLLAARRAIRAATCLAAAALAGGLVVFANGHALGPIFWPASLLCALLSIVLRRAGRVLAVVDPRDSIPLSNEDARRVYELLAARHAVGPFQQIVAKEGKPTYLTVNGMLARALRAAGP